MLLSRKWLNEFVPVEAKDRAFAEDMTLSGSKVEVTEVEGEEISNVVVGRVVEIKRHENSDHMWICQVDVGEGTPLQIVTGAQNVSQGDLVPVAKDNSTLPGGIHIKKGTLRGVESNGMLCSYKELGMTDNDWPYSVVDGIFLLESDPDLKAKGLKPGDDIRTAIGLDDHVVEFEITPNRPDCLSVIGLAREAAVTYGKALTLHDPVVNSLEVNVEIYDFLKRKGFKVRNTGAREYFLGESFYEEVYITLTTFKETEKLLNITGFKVCKYQLNLDKIPCIIIEDLIDTEQ